MVAEKLAEMCDLAPRYGIAVDLEFMPFRAVRSLAGRRRRCPPRANPNAHILIDALHVFRSNSSLDELASSIRP